MSRSAGAGNVSSAQAVDAVRPRGDRWRPRLFYYGTGRIPSRPADQNKADFAGALGSEVRAGRGLVQVRALRIRTWSEHMGYVTAMRQPAGDGGRGRAGQPRAANRGMGSTGRSTGPLHFEGLQTAARDPLKSSIHKKRRPPRAALS